MRPCDPIGRILLCQQIAFELLRGDFEIRGWRWLAFCGCRSHIVSMTDIDPSDYSVVVTMRASAAAPWKWEIYRAGRTKAIEQSSVNFRSAAEAHRAGKEALTRLLDEVCV